MMKKFSIVFLIVAALGVGFFYSWQLSHQTFLYAGTLETTKVILAAKVNTDILSFPGQEGDQVKKGELIAQLNDDSLQIAAKQLSADYIRYSKLYKTGAVTKAALDEVERANDENCLKISWCQLRSPLDGIIITKYREPGEYVNAGASVVAIADPNDIWAYFYVPYALIHKLQVGQKVTGTLAELPNKTFVGTIIKINEEAEFTPKNVQTREERTRLVYGVKVRFANPNLILKAGMTIESALE